MDEKHFQMCGHTNFLGDTLYKTPNKLIRGSKQVDVVLKKTSGRSRIKLSLNTFIVSERLVTTVLHVQILIQYLYYRYISQLKSSKSKKQKKYKYYKNSINCLPTSWWSRFRPHRTCLGDHLICKYSSNGPWNEIS